MTKLTASYILSFLVLMNW